MMGMVGVRGWGKHMPMKALTKMEVHGGVCVCV